MGDEEAEMAIDVSVLEEAFSRSGLPTPKDPGFTLGNEQWDMYVYHMLKLAGITVELVNTPAYADMTDTTLHTSVQIVGSAQAEEAMKRTNLDDIAFWSAEAVDGLQVKLNNAFGWKVSILEEIPEEGAGAGNRASRKRAAVADAMKLFQSRNLYEIVVECSKDGEAPRLRTTVAAAQIITINIAFKNTGDGVQMNNGFPEVGQRRVDVVFTNQHVVTTQVRSVFCVLCSVFCALCSAAT
jgi:hypothetical protein